MRNEVSVVKECRIQLHQRRDHFQSYETLTDKYEKFYSLNKAHLIGKFVMSRMKKGGLVTTHINEFSNMLSRLTSVSIKFEDEIHTLFLLASLSKNCDATGTTTNNSLKNTKMTYKWIIGNH